MTVHIDRGDHSVVKASLDGLVIEGRLIQEQNRYSELLKSYRYAYQLMFDDDYFCSIQIYPHKQGNRFMRLEWNPNSAERVCPNSMRRIAALLAQSVPSYSADLISSATITRIDLSFDLRRIPIDSFFVCAALRKNLSGQYLQFHEKFGIHGRLNARYIGKAESNQYLLMYDKAFHAATQQIRRNPHTKIDLKGASRLTRIMASRTRFELRLRGVGSWANLLALDNPFENYTIASRVNAGSVKNDHNWKFFIVTCDKVGAQAALSAIENRRERTRYRDALRESGPPAWWDADEIWSELPSAVYRTLGIEATSN